MASQKRIVTMILLPGLPRRSPGLTDWSSICIGEKEEENTVKIHRELSDEIETC